MKFRTMRPEAACELQRNDATARCSRWARSAGHPRRFPAQLELDELPQLFNVLKGEIRPHRPTPGAAVEVENFSDEVRLREGAPRHHQPVAGRARDNPSFDAYQRLDAYPRTGRSCSTS
jgi:hypothetical protein